MEERRIEQERIEWEARERRRQFKLPWTKVTLDCDGMGISPRQKSEVFEVGNETDRTDQSIRNAVLFDSKPIKFNARRKLRESMKEKP